MMAGDMRTLGYICPKCGAPVMGARSIFALEASDAESRQFCCFVGDEGIVDYHLREAEIAISKEKSQSGSGEAEAFTDNVIMYEFLSELRDIAARPNGITCGCGSHSYSMEIRRDAVELTCRDCGARLRLSAATDRDLDDLCCHMKLVIPGGK